MMTSPVRTLLAVTTFAGALVSLVPGSEARIVCDGPYQIVGGSSISTPYCQDAYLAQVARGYGIAVSAAEIRNNPTTKARICRAVGSDNRAQTACAAFREGGRRRSF